MDYIDAVLILCNPEHDPFDDVAAGQLLSGIEEDDRADTEGDQRMPQTAACCIRMNAVIQAKPADKV